MNNNLQNAMLIGMYISKFDKEGLRVLGFKSFSEAYNTLGLALNVRPLSIRNYRDEFDPVFPNKRKGWHKRPMYQNRKEMLLAYGHLDILEFSRIIKKIIYINPDIDLLEENILQTTDKDNQFAKRLITGQAAEQYFRNTFKSIEIFKNCSIKDTTELGCGFDFKLDCQNKFYAIEVKGLSLSTGSVMLTQKEYQVAKYLKENYFIFIVKNFIKKPVHSIFRNPVISGELRFNKKEQLIAQVSWSANV
jgi:hypothetical protein